MPKEFILTIQLALLRHLAIERLDFIDVNIYDAGKPIQYIYIIHMRYKNQTDHFGKAALVTALAS